MRTILVTGCLGTIGRRLTEELRRRGHHVFGCDLAHDASECGFRVFDIIDNPGYLRCDVGEFRQVQHLFQYIPDIELVYHTAAEFGRWNGEDFYEQLWRTNAVGTKNLLKMQKVHRFKLVHFSSSEVYGDWMQPMEESVMADHPIRQMNDYAMTKWVNEMQLQNARLEHDSEWVIVRLFNTYGPGERYSPYRSANCRMLYCALKRIPWKVHSGHVRTSSYVDDSVRTLANIAERFNRGEIYNIAGDKPHSMDELSDIILKVTGCPPELRSVMETEFQTTRYKHPVITKAVNQLEHRCEIGLEEGIARTAQWMRQEYGIAETAPKPTVRP